MAGGNEGDGDGGGGGGGDGSGGGTGQAVWQTQFLLLVQPASFHLPESESSESPLNSRQSSPPYQLSGWFAFQLVYDSGVLDGLHTHVPSDAASVPPIHTSLPAAAASSSAFCAADCTLASCRPAAWQAALASAHERVSLISV
eukprot:scaffold31430_cov50-Phaeocystis_antarctica.AAC.1